MGGYRIANTLSENGSVAGGICVKDENENHTSVVERTHIERIDGVTKFKNEDGSFTEVDEMSPVSMNMWGFTPDYFAHSDKFFVNFLNENAANIKAEFFIPLMVNELINNGTSSVKVLDTPSKWLGVTYAEYRPSVVANLPALADNGTSPTPFFNN